MPFICFLISIILCFALCACGNKSKSDPSPSRTAPTINNTDGEATAPIDSDSWEYFDQYFTFPEGGIELPADEFEDEDLPPVTEIIPAPSKDDEYDPPVSEIITTPSENTETINEIPPTRHPDILPPNEFEE